MIASFERNSRLSFTALIQEVVPKKTSMQRIQEYTQDLFPNIECFVSKSSDDERDFMLLLDQTPLNRDPEDSRRPRIWTSSDPEGVHFIYIPDLVEAASREDKILEVIVTEVFVSKVFQGPGKVKKSIALDYSKTEAKVLTRELENRKIALSLPLGAQYFAPLARVGSPLVIKHPEYERLTDSLSTMEFLKVVEGVIGGLKVLHGAGFASLDISADNIAVKRDQNGMIEGKIDHFANLTKVPPTEIDYFEEDRRELMILIGDRVLPGVKYCVEWSVPALESLALKRIEDLVNDTHYEKVLSLKLRHEGFQGEFSQDLLNYVEEMRRRGEESFQIDLLDQFARDMVLFPEVTSLLIKMIPLLDFDFKTPTFEEIEQTLKLGQSRLENLRVEKERSLVTSISLDSAEKIGYKVLPEGLYHQTHARIEAFYKVLNECLHSFPYVGSEVRIHRDVPWNDKGTISPLSFWFHVQKEAVVLQIFDQSTLEPLGVGSYKKVKAGLQVVISANEKLEFSSIAISRLRQGAWDNDVARSYKLLEKVLLEPEALEFFVPPLVKHAFYEVRRKRKLEAISYRFESIFSTITINSAINTKGKHRYVSKLEVLSLLDNIGKGVNKLSKIRMVHQDLTSRNVGLVLKNGHLRALIFDYDLLSSCGNIELPGAYFAWNRIRSKYGYVSEKTDLYAYVLMIGEALLTDFRDWNRGENENIAFRFEKLAKVPKFEKALFRIQRKMALLGKFPYVFSSEMKDFFFNFPVNPKLSDVPDSFFHYIQTIPKADGIIAFELKNFITEWLTFNLVFDLVIKTIQADLLSELKIREKICLRGQLPEHYFKATFLEEEEKEILKKIAQEALNEAGFPTHEEIERTLDSCSQIAKEIEERTSRSANSSQCVVS